MEINTFFRIPVFNNSLILCDIDETLLCYKEITDLWWTEKYRYYLSMYQNNPLIAQYKTEEDYEQYINSVDPEHTDEPGFYDMLRRIVNTNSKLIFVTARHKGSEKFTKNNFTSLNLNYEHFTVHYCDGIPKGEYIKNHIAIKNYSKIIFIDDLQENIDNVLNHLQNKIMCFKYNCRK